MKNYARSVLAACFGLFMANASEAALVTSPLVTVNRFFVFSDFGGGDVAFITSAPTTGCPGGFWLRPTDPGYKSLYAMLAMAYATKSPVQVTAYDDSIWTGSTGVYCRVYYIDAQ